MRILVSKCERLPCQECPDKLSPVCQTIGTGCPEKTDLGQNAPQVPESNARLGGLYLEPVP